MSWIYEWIEGEVEGAANVIEQLGRGITFIGVMMWCGDVVYFAGTNASIR